MSGRDRYEFDVDDGAALDARVDSGSIEIRNGAAGRITVSASGGDDDWEIEGSSSGVSIRPVKRWRVRSARVVVDVPVGTRVDVKSASASVRLAGTYGETSLRSASGDLLIGTPASVSAATASGDVRVEGVEADASMTTASGDVEVGRVGGRLSVTTASGDVRVAAVEGDLRVGTTSGDVRVDRSNGSDIAVKSVSGDVTLGLPSGIRVEPDLTTLSGRTNLPVPAPPSATRRPGETATASPPDRRTVTVNVRTVSGDITITRAD